uniref:Uncharacterized protein n=1 Tax=Rhizophagus irregularis (strain DAOM 181602 / DAOM 197198 / MUCL 43194) TaxID=747089 RepID=U9TKI2_RHIID
MIKFSTRCLVLDKNFTINFQKVLAYTNDPFNAQIDTLAKSAHLSWATLFLSFRLD